MRNDAPIIIRQPTLLMDYQVSPVPVHTTSNDNQCLICGSSALGMNFGVLTCAPCKAFFRRNARRKELLDLPCRHRTFASVINENLYIRQRAARYLQIRRCSSCRLRRCFEVGMKEELVRTDEENQRYRELVKVNRERREDLKEQLLKIKELSVPQKITNTAELSNGIDWQHLSNIVYAYDSQCIKQFIEKRSTVIFVQDPSQLADHPPVRPQPTVITGTIVSCATSFLQSLPAFYSLSRSARNYLLRVNLRPLIFPNLHELTQNCYAEPWQVESFAATWQMMCGAEVYPDFRQVERLMDHHIVNDPVVTRLWMIVLFFSTPLHYHNDGQIVTPLLKKKSVVMDAQNAYATLIWKYLLYRHQEHEAVRIYSDLIRVYLKMQHVGFQIYLQLRSKQELAQTHDALQKLILAETDEHRDTTTTQ